MENIVILEWKFSPPNYFEEKICIQRDDYIITIGSGTIEAQIRPEVYDEDQSMRNRLHSTLNDRFLAVQLLSHKPYELSEASLYRLHEDGRKDNTIFANPGVMTVEVEADFILIDKDGNITRDSKKERIQKKRELADLVEKYRTKDSLLVSLLNSYSKAVNDPGNELVYLYEIRDAIAKKYGGELGAKNSLGISGTQWSKLGNLANDYHLKQGRHRGKNQGVLRNATEAELKEARSIAYSLVEAHLNYLEKCN